MTDSGEKRPIPNEASHVVEPQLGGTPHLVASAPKKRPRRIYLRMVDQEVTFEPRSGLPAGGRDECRTGERPCPYVRCKWHLWLVLAEDRAGRRGSNTTLEPRWLEHPTPPCCALDFADAVKNRGEAESIAMIANVMGRERSVVWRVLTRAIGKLRARGLEVSELMR